MFFPRILEEPVNVSFCVCYGNFCGYGQVFKKLRGKGCVHEQFVKNFQAHFFMVHKQSFDVHGHFSAVRGNNLVNYCALCNCEVSPGKFLKIFAGTFARFQGKISASSCLCVSRDLEYY